MSIAKQKRSKYRIEKILDTAESIIESSGVESISVAKISEISGLKRTSTYKFFQNPNQIKQLLIEKYINEIAEELNNKNGDIYTNEPSVVILKCTNIIYEYFLTNNQAQELILKNTLNPSINKSSIHALGKSIQTYVDSNIKMPSFFNKDGVFRVLAQIILSVFSLNAKEDGVLNEVGKIEAHRAGHAYILNWIEQSKEN